MRIGIDARYLSHGLVGGVHTYLRELLPEMLRVGTGHEFILYADRKRAFELPDLPAHATLRLLPWRSAASSVRNDFALRRTMARDGLDVAHFPANCGQAPPGVAGVVTVHDALNLLPLSHVLRAGGSAWTSRARLLAVYLHWQTVAAVRHATTLITVSEYSRRDIARLGPFDAGRITVIPHAPPAAWPPAADAAVRESLRARYDLRGGLVLADGLKNPGVSLAAWNALPEDLRCERMLVFFARTDTLLPVVDEAVRGNRVRLVVRPSRDELAALFSLADVFLFPSWTEGFGIPIVEAMACGTPVIASDRGAIPEVVGHAALLADPERPETFAAALRRLLGDADLASRLRAGGRARAGQLTWTEIATRTLDVYRAAAALVRSAP